MRALRNWRLIPKPGRDAVVDFIRTAAAGADDDLSLDDHHAIDAAISLLEEDAEELP